MNAWLNRCVFNLDLNRESVSEPRMLSGRLFQSLGAKYEKVLPPLVDFAILRYYQDSFTRSTINRLSQDCVRLTDTFVEQLMCELLVLVARKY